MTPFRVVAALVGAGALGAGGVLGVTALHTEGRPAGTAAAGTGPAAGAAVDAAAADGAGSAGVTAADRLVDRAVRRARATRYSGVVFIDVFNRGGVQSVVLTVSHLPGEGSVVRLSTTPGQRGGEVFAPDAAADLGLLGGLGPEAVALLERDYTLGCAGADRVAGRVAEVVDVRGARGRLAGVLWLDRAAGLLLREQVFDGAGRTVREAAFVSVSVAGTAAAPGPAAPPVGGAAVAMTGAAAEPVDQLAPGLGTAAQTRLRAAGWLLPTRLPGGMALFDARLAGAGPAPTLHLSYSDGLAALSLFEQPGQLSARAVRGWSRQQVDGQPVFVRAALPFQATWSSGGRVFTLLADAPDTVVDQAVAALPHRPLGHGLLARLRRGLDRLGSWVNPFR